MEHKSWSSNEMAAVSEIVAAWDALVAKGDMDDARMAKALVRRLDGGTLCRVEAEAARQWLADHDRVWMAADPELAEQTADMLGSDTPEWLAELVARRDAEQRHEAAMATADRAEAMAAELAELGLAELEDRALELARAARNTARRLEQEIGRRG